MYFSEWDGSNKIRFSRVGEIDYFTTDLINEYFDKSYSDVDYCIDAYINYGDDFVWQTVIMYVNAMLLIMMMTMIRMMMLIGDMW